MNGPCSGEPRATISRRRSAYAFSRGSSSSETLAMARRTRNSEAGDAGVTVATSSARSTRTRTSSSAGTQLRLLFGSGRGSLVSFTRCTIQAHEVENRSQPMNVIWSPRNRQIIERHDVTSRGWLRPRLGLFRSVRTAHRPAVLHLHLDGRRRAAAVLVVLAVRGRAGRDRPRLGGCAALRVGHVAFLPMETLPHTLGGSVCGRPITLSMTTGYHAQGKTDTQSHL